MMLKGATHRNTELAIIMKECEGIKSPSKGNSNQTIGILMEKARPSHYLPIITLNVNDLNCPIKR